MRFLFAIACCVYAVSPLFAADDFTAEKAKALIPEAAGMPAEELQKLTAGEDFKNFKSAKGYSLTWGILNYTPKPMDTDPVSFHFLGESPNPARIASAIAGPKDKDGKFRKTATVIQPEYITDCTCKIEGDTATGTVSFKAEKAYQGKIEYTARKKDGVWRIIEFRIPEIRLIIVLGDDGKWVKK
jgi:hypothetical protein